MLGQRTSRLGGRTITAIVSVLCAYSFGSTAWQQFAETPPGSRIAATICFALFGAGAAWLVYLLIRLVIRLLK